MNINNLATKIRGGVIKISTPQDITDLVCICIDYFNKMKPRVLASKLKGCVDTQNFLTVYAECISQNKDYRRTHTGSVYKSLRREFINAQETNFVRIDSQKCKKKVWRLRKQTNQTASTNVSCVVNGMVVTRHSYADIYDEYSNR